MPPLVLRLDAEIGQLPSLRRFIAEAGAAWQVPPEVLDPLVLAVDELATNIVVYGCRGQPGSLEVEIERTTDALIVRLRDQTPPFDPRLLPEPDLTLPLEQRPAGGLGVYLARRCVDGLTYEVSEQGGNLLTLVKRTAAT